MKTGVQLWTLREYCTNLSDFSETLKKVADMGFKSVQVSGTCDYEPEWLSEQLRANGLVCPITHYDVNKLINDPIGTAKKHDIFQCHSIGYGGKHNRPEGYDEILSSIGDAAQKIYNSGKQFTYHHHSWEYQSTTADGSNLMQYLSDTFSAEQMHFTLDTYWVKYAGFDVSSEIKRLSGRIRCVHIKDMLILPNGEKQMCFIGGGNCMNFEKLLQEFSDSATEYALVEQDDCYGNNPFEELKKSFDYLKSIGLK